MSNFILCLECKKYLGKYKLFIEAYTMCIKMLDDKIDSVSPDNMNTVPSLDLDINMGDLLDALKIDNICCRMHTITAADFFSFLDMKTEI